GIPLMKPPYGRITAIDLDKGEIVWQIAHGETPDNIRNHPLLKGVNIPRTGRAGIVGTLVTKTLVISGEPGVFTTPNGQKGAMLRAYDKQTGREVGAVYMPTQQSGTPMTYMLNGKQYIVVAIGGIGYTAELRAYRLPNLTLSLTTGHLYFWVLLAIMSGGVLVYVSPATAVKLKPLGDG